MEVKGRKVKMSIWVSAFDGIKEEKRRAENENPLALPLAHIGHSRSRTLPHHHGIVLSWRAGCHPRSVYSARYPSLLSTHVNTLN
jgi:hypothetical protein